MKPFILLLLLAIPQEPNHVEHGKFQIFAANGPMVGVKIYFEHSFKGKPYCEAAAQVMEITPTTLMLMAKVGNTVEFTCKEKL